MLPATPVRTMHVSPAGHTASLLRRQSFTPFAAAARHIHPPHISTLFFRLKQTHCPFLRRWWNRRKELAGTCAVGGHKLN